MDEDLPRLREVAAGSEPALAALLERHRDTVFRLAWRLVGNGHDAAEITAETFVRVHRHASRFEPRASVRSWILAIATNLARDLLRRRAFRPWFLAPPARDEDEEDARTPVDPGPDARAAAEQAELAGALAEAVGRLPARLRLPFVLCALEGHSQDEAAVILGTTRKAVETRVARARDRLARSLSHLSR